MILLPYGNIIRIYPKNQYDIPERELLWCDLPSLQTSPVPELAEACLKRHSCRRGDHYHQGHVAVMFLTIISSSNIIMVVAIMMVIGWTLSRTPSVVGVKTERDGFSTTSWWEPHAPDATGSR